MKYLFIYLFICLFVFLFFCLYMLGEFIGMVWFACSWEWWIVWTRCWWGRINVGRAILLFFWVLKECLAFGWYLILLRKCLFWVEFVLFIEMFTGCLFRWLSFVFLLDVGWVVGLEGDCGWLNRFRSCFLGFCYLLWNSLFLCLVLSICFDFILIFVIFIILFSILII